MQLTNIAFATIFIAFLVTISVRCGDPANLSFAKKLAKFRDLEKTPEGTGGRPLPKGQQPSGSKPTVAPYPSQSSAQPSVLPGSAGEGSASSQSPMPPTSTLNPQTLKDFKDAVHEHELGRAWEIYEEANDETRRQCGGHLVNLGDGELVRMINGIHGMLDKASILGIVSAHAREDLFSMILNEVKPDDEVLRYSTLGNAELACNTGRFMTVVKGITNKDNQEWATRFGVDALFEKDKTECLDPMISALQSKASDPDLANEAIRQAFWKAIEYTDHRSFLAEHFHDHCAISAEIYSRALCKAYETGKPDYILFNWLIERADRDDLKELKSNKRFKYLSPQDKKYVNDRLESIKDDPETRPKKGERLRRERREKVKEVLETSDEIRGHELPSALIDHIINEYDR